eukprot:1776687-Pyramimonas_sp.AAC.1
MPPGLDTDIKPLLSQFTTEEFNSPPNYSRTPLKTRALRIPYVRARGDINGGGRHANTGRANKGMPPVHLLPSCARSPLQS